MTSKNNISLEILPRTVNEKSKEKSQPGGSLYFGLKNQQEWRMADHNGSTDVSTTPLLGVLDTNHHVSHVCMYGTCVDVQHELLAVYDGEPLLHSLLLQHGNQAGVHLNKNNRCCRKAKKLPHKSIRQDKGIDNWAQHRLKFSTIYIQIPPCTQHSYRQCVGYLQNKTYHQEYLYQGSLTLHTSRVPYVPIPRKSKWITLRTVASPSDGGLEGSREQFPQLNTGTETGWC
jgi:hypothetical protein